MKSILILAVIAIGCKLSSAQFCGLESCGNGIHIDCVIEDESWGPTCPDDKNMLNLRDVQDMILDKFNTERNKFAGGLVSGFQPANRMGRLIWNVTLANLARKNVRLCEFKHDGCRNTQNFNFVGQDIAYRKYGKTVDLKNIDILLDLCDKWIAEKSQLTMNDIRAHPATDTVNNIAQILKAYATQVGCAASKQTLSNNIVVLFTCNYNMGNIAGWPTYDEGPAASKCAAKDTTYKNLCATGEEYNVNEFWLDYY